MCFFNEILFKMKSKIKLDVNEFLVVVVFINLIFKVVFVEYFFMDMEKLKMCIEM